MVTHRPPTILRSGPAPAARPSQPRAGQRRQVISQLCLVARHLFLARRLNHAHRRQRGSRGLNSYVRLGSRAQPCGCPLGSTGGVGQALPRPVTNKAAAGIYKEPGGGLIFSTDLV